MMNKLTVPSKTNLANRQQTAQLSLATMQADMADMRAALKNKQRASVVQKENIKSKIIKLITDFLIHGMAHMPQVWPHVGQNRQKIL